VHEQGLPDLLPAHQSQGMPFLGFSLVDKIADPSVQKDATDSQSTLDRFDGSW
jgi:hypothetical protein